METQWVHNPFYPDASWFGAGADEVVSHFPSAPAYFIAANNQWTDELVELGVDGVTVRQVVPCASLTAAKLAMVTSKVVPWLGKGVVVTQEPKGRMGVVYRVVMDGGNAMETKPTEEHRALAAKNAGLGVGHIWTNTQCEAYWTYNPTDCRCRD